MACYVAGDIHGGTRNLDAIVAQIPPDDPEPQLVLAGDVGLGYGPIRHYDLQEAMAAYANVQFLIMRGNHDIRYQRDIRNWSYVHKTKDHKGFRPLWNHPEHSPRGTSGLAQFPLSWCLADKDIPNIIYLPDTPWLAFDESMTGSVLFIPGAYSVDKHIRLAQDLPYEPEELLTAHELAEAAEMLSDICSANPSKASPPLAAIVSHTCPQSAVKYLSDLLLSGISPNIDHSQEQFLDILLDMALEAERTDMPNRFDWWFGHFHDDRQMQIESTSRTCDMHLLFRGLGLLSQSNLVLAAESKDQVDKLWKP